MRIAIQRDHRKLKTTHLHKKLTVNLKVLFMFYGGKMEKIKLFGLLREISQ